jgi:hypothetical protein
LAQAEDDRKAAAIATRCLELLVAPDERMFFEQAWIRWRYAEAAANEIWSNGQATVEQVVAAGYVIASWQKYWSKYHYKPRERKRCLVAWMDTLEVLENHRRRTNEQT